MLSLLAALLLSGPLLDDQVERRISTTSERVGAMAFEEEPVPPELEPPRPVFNEPIRVRFVASSPKPAPDVDVIGGAAVSLGSEAESEVEAFARISVDWPLAGVDRPLGARVVAELSALPGKTLALGDVATFRSLELAVSAGYKPIFDFSGELFCEGGFGTRLPADAREPETTAPLWGACGLRFTDKSEHRGRLQLGVGADERLDGEWGAAVTVSGSVRIFGQEGGGFGSTLVVRAILGLEADPRDGIRRNVITAAVGGSWSKKK